MLIVTRDDLERHWFIGDDVTVIVLGVQGSPSAHRSESAQKHCGASRKRSSHGSGRESRIPRDRDHESQISFVMITLSIISSSGIRSRIPQAPSPDRDGSLCALGACFSYYVAVRTAKVGVKGVIHRRKDRKALKSELIKRAWHPPRVGRA